MRFINYYGGLFYGREPFSEFIFKYRSIFSPRPTEEVVISAQSFLFEFIGQNIKKEYGDDLSFPDIHLPTASFVILREYFRRRGYSFCMVGESSFSLNGIIVSLV